MSLKVLEVQTSKLDGTQKYLFALPDGNGGGECSDEIPSRKQCVHFFSGGMPKWAAGSALPRSGDGPEICCLREMLDQVYKIQKLSKERVSNVVVMGTGEPLDNYDNLLRFIRMLSDEKGLHISQRNITVSTCGIVPRMYDLAEEDLQITLAISLHASNQKKRGTAYAHRQEIIPGRTDEGLQKLF